jgi:DNA (cytosine-5)-methyltransferase 1
MNYKVVDLFAGAGGFGLGFHLAKFDVKLSLEKDNWAVKTLRANRLNSQRITHSDIKKFTSAPKIRSFCKFIPDIIIGGPPCQGFSGAGIKKRDANDSRNMLIKYFLKWVNVLQPKTFVIENVKGILSWKNNDGEKILDIIKKTLNGSGYNLEVWVLNASEYGVPQNRERVFIVGNIFGVNIGPPPKTHKTIGKSTASVKNDVKIKLKSPITVWHALSDLPKIKAGEGKATQKYNGIPETQYQKWVRKKSEILFNHVAMKHTPRLIRRFKEIQNGNSLAEIHDDFKVKKRGGNGILSETEFHSNYRHLKKNNVSYTIPASFYSSFIHPTTPRNITAREAARLQSFPDWYRFKGKRTVVSSKLLKRLGKHEENFLSQYNQIGNAVPPLLAKAIAEHIKLFLDSKK